MKKYEKPVITVKEIRPKDKVATLGAWLSSPSNTSGLTADSVTTYSVDDIS